MSRVFNEWTWPRFRAAILATSFILAACVGVLSYTAGPSTAVLPGRTRGVSELIMQVGQTPAWPPPLSAYPTPMPGAVAVPSPVPAIETPPGAATGTMGSAIPAVAAVPVAPVAGAPAGWAPPVATPVLPAPVATVAPLAPAASTVPGVSVLPTAPILNTVPPASVGPTAPAVPGTVGTETGAGGAGPAWAGQGTSSGAPLPVVPSASVTASTTPPVSTTAQQAGTATAAAGSTTSAVTGKVVGSATTTPALPGVRPACNGEGEICSASHCCTAETLKCYSQGDKDVCALSCKPGKHSEADGGDWTCNVLPPPGAAEKPAAPATLVDGANATESAAVIVAKPNVTAVATTPLPADAVLANPKDNHGDTCAEDGKDCRKQGCCKNSDRSCFVKSMWWAECLTSCVPGMHATDVGDAREPWTCEFAKPWVPLPADEKPVAAATPYTSIFCFMVFKSASDEAELVRAQLPIAGGVFGCDDFMLFSDEVQPELPHSFALALTSQKSVAGALTATWVNSDEFIAAWEAVVADHRYAFHDWVLKADPDAVFIPKALVEHLGRFESQAAAGGGIYLKNCADGPRSLQLFGSVEILSQLAVTNFGANRDTCKTMEHALMGEDMWLQKCMDKLGVVGVEDYEFLADGYCPSSPGIDLCQPPRVAFHPFKKPVQWLLCYNEAKKR